MRPKNAWLKLHKPELLEQFKLSDFELHLVEQGNEVELAARALWPHGILVTTVDDEARRETEGLICASHRGDRIDIPFCTSPPKSTHIRNVQERQLVFHGEPSS
jgi:hypothetical protein